jgi:nucleoside-diphosphate-sugar epimerase
MLVTGSNGFIGGNLVRKYNADGVDLRNFYDIYNHKPELIIHCGALTKINSCIKAPELCFLQNVRLTEEVFEYARKIDSDIVFFSSSRVLNRENNPYTASKIYGEELCKAYYDCYGLRYKIIRPSTVYGPHCNTTPRLVTIWALRALKDEPLIVYGNDKKTLDFTYIDDFLEAVDLILTKGNWNEDYDIGGDSRYVVDAAKIIIEETKSESSIMFTDTETAQPQTVKVDWSKVARLGYKPKYTLETGLKKTLEEGI